MVRNIFITGAQFKNKGAQSLLFSVIYQLNSIYPDAEYYYYPLDNPNSYDASLYKFHIVNWTRYSFKYCNDSLFRALLKLFSPMLKIIGKGDLLKKTKEYYETIQKMDLMVDISGYQLGSKWDIGINIQYLNFIEIAQSFNVPVVLMPQSFGPFDYGMEQEKMDNRICNILSKVNLIYAREERGYRLLSDKYKLENVYKCCDIVLQTAGEIDLSLVFNKIPIKNIHRLKACKNVGVIPNFQTIKQGNKKEILILYKDIIDSLTSDGYQVTIFRHSDDLKLCRMIYQSISNRKDQVDLIENEFECYEYSEFVKQFDFLIASRYHAVLHAYQKGVPCLVLGWDEKYMELAHCFQQDKYVADISTKFDANKIKLSFVELKSNFPIEKETILSKLVYLPVNKCVMDLRDAIH